VDHTAELVRENGAARVGSPSLELLDSGEEGLRLLDRYPWARLYPMYVHPAFVERVRVAVEERLADVDPDGAEQAREKWRRLFNGMQESLLAGDLPGSES